MVANNRKIIQYTINIQYTQLKQDNLRKLSYSTT